MNYQLIAVSGNWMFLQLCTRARSFFLNYFRFFKVKKPFTSFSVFRNLIIRLDLGRDRLENREHER